MTTLKAATAVAVEAEIARRTEALFRSSGALREGHFLLKSGRHSNAYLEKFAVLADPAATSELCGFWAARHRSVAGTGTDGTGPDGTGTGGTRADGTGAGGTGADGTGADRTGTEGTGADVAGIGTGGTATRGTGADVAGAGGAGAPTVDLVAGPTTGGVILAFETGRQLGTRAIFAEEVHAGGQAHREFRRGFRIEPGERVLLVDDILTTGGSLLAMIPAVEQAGGEIVECAVMVDRSGGMPTLTSPATGRVYPLRALWVLDLPTYEPGASTCPRCADGTPLSAPGSTGTLAPAG